MSRVHAALLTAAVIAAAAGVREMRAQAFSHHLSTQKYEDMYYLPPPEYLAVASLGHREALAGLIWLKSLVYFGEELVHRGSVRNLFSYADAMLTLDPNFKKVYHWVATSAVYHAGEIKADEARRAVAYLKSGVRRFPDDGELAWDLGAQQMWELAPLMPDGPERRAVQEEAVQHLQVAVLRGAGPEWLAKAVATQMRKQGHREQALRHLKEVYPMLTDPELKAAVLADIGRHESAAVADAMASANKEFAETHARDYPFLNSTLYLLVGPRPPFDGDGLIARNFDPFEELVMQVPSTPQPNAP